MQSKLNVATILDHEEHCGNEIPVIAAIRVPAPYADHPGLLMFRCPMCGEVHTHGACGPKFGAGDGDRSPHCRTPLEERDYDLYILREVHDVSLVGDLPPEIMEEVLTVET